MKWSLRHALTLSVAFTALPLLAACGSRDEPDVDTPATEERMDAEMRVTDLELGREIGATRHVVAEVSEFRPDDTIYAVVSTRGTGTGSLTARWTFEDGQVVDETKQDVAPADGQAVTEFHVAKASGWPVGKYKVEILVNGNVVESEEFTVK
jgi:hypothetical protein